MTPLQRLQHLIDTYDWYYEMSDDFGVWQAGKRRDQDIAALTEIVGREIYLKMWNEKVDTEAKNFRDPEEFTARYRKAE